MRNTGRKIISNNKYSIFFLLNLAYCGIAVPDKNDTKVRGGNVILMTGDDDIILV